LHTQKQKIPKNNARRSINTNYSPFCRSRKQNFFVVCKCKTAEEWFIQSKQKSLFSTFCVFRKNKFMLSCVRVQVCFRKNVSLKLKNKIRDTGFLADRQYACFVSVASTTLLLDVMTLCYWGFLICSSEHWSVVFFSLMHLRMVGYYVLFLVGLLWVVDFSNGHWVNESVELAWSHLNMVERQDPEYHTFYNYIYG
jgi:hypothetical protein